MVWEVNLGFQEVLVIALVFILLFGPERAKDVFRKFGEFYRDLMQSLNEVKKEMNYDEEEGNGKSSD